MNIEKEKLYYAFMSGANEVMDNKMFLNEINVFPVADSDTGSNLYNMMNHIVLNSELKASVSATLQSIADSAIVGARGNSGLIFAQYFHGISLVSNEYSEITASDFVRATHLGFEHAYKSVEEPIEGTILTTMRVFYEALNLGVDEATSFIELLENAYISVENAVLKTTEQLINLKKASVVDSGAKGFSYFLKGFIDGIKGGSSRSVKVKTEDIRDELARYEFYSRAGIHDFSAEVKFRYCSEALMEASELDNEIVKAKLREYGDSIVISGGRRKKRIHIHTNDPWKVFGYLSEKNNIISTKVDDMNWQYNLKYSKKYSRVIVTDSIADIPKDILDEEQVAIINLELLLGRESHIDKLSLTNGYLFEQIEKNKIKVTSSQPKIDNINKFFATLMNHYDEVIVISVSKELSGTYNVLNRVSKKFSDKISVYDSKQNSVGQGLIVLNAIENIREKKTSKEIVESIEKSIEKTKILVSISNLDRMIASGRVSSRFGKIANGMGLKAVVTLDEYGKGAVEMIAMGRKNASKKIINKLKKVNLEHGIQRYALTYVDDKIIAEDLAKEIESVLGFPSCYIVESSSIIASGAGSGAVAVAYTRY